MFPIAFDPIYKYPVPEGHRFPMDKYELLPLQLLREGIAKHTDFFSPEPVDMQAVYAVHDRAYADRFAQGKLTQQEMRRIGFTQTPLLAERELRIANGTVQGALKALDTGIAFNIAGGTHHAGRDFGEGFCMINDQAVAAQYLIDHKKAKKVLIIDLDVHQGNGTAHIFADQPRIFTFSMHGKNNYPFRKEKSDLDVALDDRTDDNTYLRLLKEILPNLVEQVRPDFIFYQAGVDILETDKIGRMSCTVQGCRHRDEMVLQIAAKHNIPVQCSMGGGYSPQLRTILNAHANTYQVASQIFPL
ncbi:histone deacetylase family protein [Dyadobacter fanqingshengii]|uniref:Histone deacetylase n=1 Tax=Dyadobacter fanqingshengii TaxID=2906443 RepID=A0A9X1P804_9BACT|nr:histone deacetylase [Dyadobacter fanqingshengii]MCF0040479.1 histone deacetylase [Dyadobacter fanqingshengii]USJ37779.1 histone deacetylase [Dyadobacter fanqingshengii]